MNAGTPSTRHSAPKDDCGGKSISDRPGTIGPVEMAGLVVQL